VGDTGIIPSIDSSVFKVISLEDDFMIELFKTDLGEVFEVFECFEMLTFERFDELF